MSYYTIDPDIDSDLHYISESDNDKLSDEDQSLIEKYQEWDENIYGAYVDWNILIRIESGENMNTILLKDDPNFDYDYYGYEFEIVDNESDTYILIFYSYHKNDNVLCVKICPCKINGKEYNAVTMQDTHLILRQDNYKMFIQLFKKHFLHITHNEITLSMYDLYDEKKTSFTL